jgi:hypothetical protein
LPEKGLISVAEGNRSRCTEECHIFLVARKLGSHPRPIWVSPLKPRPSQTQGPTKELEVWQSKSAQLKRSTNRVPVNQRVPTTSHLASIPLPHETPGNLVRLLHKAHKGIGRTVWWYVAAARTVFARVTLPGRAIFFPIHLGSFLPILSMRG